MFIHPKNCSCVSCPNRDAERKAAGEAWDARYAGKGNNLAMGLAVGSVANRIEG